ncbi:MAG: FimV/HubP family polar landmark protein [Pseudomonadota bacterium]
MRSRCGHAGRLARALLCCCLLWGGHAQALGLGSELHVRSALNQPLQAELPLVLAPGEAVTDVKVGLAGREAYRRIGLPYHEGLPPLSFKIARGATGQPVIQISSRQPVREPALELLLEIRWGRSSVLRQYALLLDPPSLYAPPAATSVPAPAALEAPAPPVTVAAPVLQAAPVVASYGPVQRGETLSQIAQRLKPEGVGTPQMTVALFEANPHAFIGGNMNRLRWGTTLYMPSAEAITARSRGAAGRVMLQQQRALQPDAAPEPETTTGASAAAAPEPAPALQILAPSAPEAGDGELEQRLAEVRELNATVAEENEELRQRLGALEQQAQRLAEQVLTLPVAAPATVEPPAVTAPVSEPAPAQGAAPAAEPAGDARLALAAATPASRWQSPAWWIAVLAGLLLASLALLGWLWWRRSRRWEYRDLAQALRDDAEAKARAREAMLEKARHRFR